MEILNVENLTFSYPLNEHNTLSSVSFSLEKGDFAVLCGQTGSGKTTLLRMLKPSLCPRGERSGKVSFYGTDLYENKTNEKKIGFVMQNPEQQIVTDKVYHELAFALENQNLPNNEISRRIAEAAQFFGIFDIFEENTDILSGGQKQLLNLASVSVMQPDLLILDEPTAQLDPVAAAEFMTVLKKLNTEMGITVLISEHRLDDLLSLCNKLIVIDSGEITVCDETSNAIRNINKDDKVIEYMPATVRLYKSVKTDSDCPLTVNDGRRFLESNFSNGIKEYKTDETVPVGNKAVEINDLYFRYSKDESDVLSGLNLTVYENEIFSILGANGSGKTTALSCIAGLIKPYSGKVKVFGKKVSEYKNNSLYINCVTLLPQDIGTVFLKNTVKEELEEVKATLDGFPFDLSGLLDRHPYDLSGGEQQLVALAKVLASKPKILILDEPTKGLDNCFKKIYASVLKQLKNDGVTIIAVTHDVEFAAMISDRCAFLFRGRAVSVDNTHSFFTKNSFYTTCADRMARGFYDGVVSVEEIVEMIGLNGGEIL
ncbi:MAG: ATP-binding cassette domain-containing protein [Clostridiales bacterium]|nr:ATP-binding cassette domain-containing protein [Clostridiales bacterium]